MAESLVVCPLCGFEFDKEDSLCQHGCPWKEGCKLVRCPSCDYEFPEKPQIFYWIRRLLGRHQQRLDEPEKYHSVREMKPGETATVRGLVGENRNRQNTLAVFGLVPGSEITLIQRQPSYVVRIEETELALDPEIAGDIAVEARKG